MRLLAVCEVRRTADSRKGESGAKPGAEQSIAATGASFQWVETECPEAQAREPRIPVQVRKGAGQESESS